MRTPDHPCDDPIVFQNSKEHCCHYFPNDTRCALPVGEWWMDAALLCLGLALGVVIIILREKLKKRI